MMSDSGNTILRARAAAMVASSRGGHQGSAPIPSEASVCAIDR